MNRASAGTESRGRLERWGWRAACLPAGALVTLGFPEANVWLLGWVGLVPTILLLAAAENMRDAAWRSWAAGTGFGLGLFHWLLGVMEFFAPFPPMAFGLTWIPVGLVVHKCAKSSPMGRPWLGAATAVVVVPSAWVVVDYMRSWHMLGGSWGPIGLTQWQTGPALQVAALGGVWALTWLLLASNVGIAMALRRSTPSDARLAALGIPAALAVLALGWGALRELPAPYDTFSVAGIQPGLIVDNELRLQANEELTAQVNPAAEGIDMIVWGQSSVGFDPNEREDIRDRIQAVATRAGVPLLVNVDARRADGRISKSSVLFDPVDGMVATYDKQRLVPFGEFIPLRPLFGWVERFTEAAEEDRFPGGELTVFDISGTRVGPLISYESSFPDLRRSLARMDPEVIVVQGASTTFQGSWAQPQQAAGDAIRAVESGRPSILVAVSGTSSAFDAEGNQLAWLPADQTGVIRAVLPVGPVATPYVRWGDWVPLGSLLVVVAWLAWVVVDRRARHSSSVVTGERAPKAEVPG